MKNWQKNLALTAFLAFLAGSFWRGWMKAGADIENPKILAEMRDAMVRMAPPALSDSAGSAGFFCYPGGPQGPGPCYSAESFRSASVGSVMVIINEKSRVSPKSVKWAVFGE